MDSIQRKNLTSIVIVTYNSRQNIEQCLESVKKHTSLSYEIITVDDASQDNTSQYLSKRTDCIHIQNNSNAGFSKACNQGVRKSSGDRIVFLNPDTRVHENWLELLTAHLDERTPAVGPLSNRAAGDQNWIRHVTESDRAKSPEELAKAVAKNNKGKSQNTRLLTGFCLLVDRSVFQDLGMFDEAMFVGGEDLDLCWRLRREGYSLKVALDVFVYHKGQENFKTESEQNRLKLTRDSHKVLKDKLNAYYGIGSAPDGEELWGVGWFEPDSTSLQNPLYSIIIPVHNGCEYTKECIESVRNYTPMDRTEIIVVDNGSEDDTGAYLKKNSDIISILNEENRGFATAVNQGLRLARGEYYVVLNNDVVVTENWLGNLGSVARSDEWIGLLGPVTNHISGRQKIENARYDTMDDMHKFASERWSEFGLKYLDEANLRGFCLFIKKGVVDTIGGFDERFRIGNYEDDDFCLRALNAGFKCGIAEGVFVHHHGSATFRLLKEEYTSLLDENAKRFAQKWNITPPEREAEPQPAMTDKPGSAGLREMTDDQCERLLEEGNRLISEQRIEEGLNKYRQILETRKDHVETLHNYHAVLFQTGNEQEGLSGLNSILKIDPSFAEVYHTLGLVSESRGENEEALRLFRQCIERDINHEKAYRSYERAANNLGMDVKEKTTDFVFYTGGTKFDGSTIHKQGLGGSESALYHVAKCIAEEGYSVKVFNNCDVPGIYDGVEYNSPVDFYLYNRWNSCNVFISSRSFKPVFFDVHAKLKIVWLHDMPNVAFLDQYDFKNTDFSNFVFFALSNYHADQWQEFLKIDRSRIHVTRNGFDPERFKDKGIRRKRSKLIYSSRPNRGLDVLLDIFPEIRKNIPDAELHVFSYTHSENDKEIRPYLDKMEQPGVVSRGSVPQEVLAEEIMESRLLVYPSTFKETSCITAIEAQAAGTPIVTTNLAALPETVANGVSGVVIDGDAHTQEYQKKFVDEVVRLINDDDAWTKLSEGGKKRALDYFTWKAISQEWLEFFSKKLQNKTEEPKLSLCMIVKNEEKTLRVCLESVKDIVDEIIVVDTGSTDNTIQVAKSFGAIVEKFEWIDDFSAARNRSLERATGDWILYLDADEKITPENGQMIREAIRHPDLTAVNMIEHIPQEKGNLFKTASSDYCRLFRNDPKIRFAGRIHEQILPSINSINGKVLKSSIRIDHWGFAISEEKRKTRAERNLKLILLELEEDPSKNDDPFTHFNIGMTYAAMGRNSEAKSSLLKSTEIHDSTMKNEIRSTAMAKAAQLAFMEDDLKQAQEHAERSIGFDERNMLARYIIVGVLFQREDYERAKKTLQNLLEITKESNVHSGIDTGQIHLDLGNCNFKMNMFHEAIDCYKQAEDIVSDSFELFFNFGISYLNINNEEKAGEYFRKAKTIRPELPDPEDIIKEFMDNSQLQDEYTG